ncbi:unnamed protein product, partial [Polarella glacialis]
MGRARSWQSAASLLDDMVELRSRPDAISLGTAVSACARHYPGGWQQALSLILGHRRIPYPGSVAGDICVSASGCASAAVASCRAGSQAAVLVALAAA